jgi:hypothetical protein
MDSAPFVKTAGTGTGTPGSNIYAATGSSSVAASGPVVLAASDFIAIDTRKLYKFTYYFYADTGSSGLLYASVSYYDSAKNFISISHPIRSAVNYSSLAVPGWNTAIGYMRGSGAAINSSSTTVQNPAPFPSDTKYIKPTIYLNWTGSGNSYLDHVRIEVVDEEAARVVNAGSVQIDPGKILISGATSLSDWRQGGDTTKIAGGSISANTIDANKLTIGQRGVSIAGIEFEHNSPAINQVSWTAGNVAYVNDAGTSVSVAITASNITWASGTLYIYWVKGATTLSSSTLIATAMGVNNVVLASYRGGVDLVTEYGRTVIEGSKIKTGSIQTSQLAAGSVSADRLNVNSLSAITANLGTVTAGLIQSANGKFVINLAAGSLTITS